MRGWSIPVVTGDNFLAPLYSAQFPPAETLAELGPKGKELHPLLGGEGRGEGISCLSNRMTAQSICTRTKLAMNRLAFRADSPSP